MFEIQCLDSYGNTINHFTQWDIDQKVIIPIDSCNLPESELPSSPAYATPEVHFCNTKMDERYIVRSEVVDGKTISAEVPNILLQEPYPILVYVYMVDSQDASSQKAILRNEIPVRKAVKPSDYFYIENIKRITAEMIKEEIVDAVKDEKQSAIDAINNKKDSSESAVESAKTTAIKNITTTTSNAQKEVDNQMDKNYNEGSITVGDSTYTGGFVNVGNDIIKELDKIKQDSQDEYDENHAAAIDTQARIEESVNATIHEDGLLLDTKYNDDTGNVDVVILFDRQTTFAL